MNLLQLALYPEVISAPSKDAGVRKNAEVQTVKAMPVVNPLQVVESELTRIFPTKLEESKAELVRRIMGARIADLSEEELNAYITQFQFLVETWMDEFEKQVFEGRTLEQVLKEG